MPNPRSGELGDCDIQNLGAPAELLGTSLRASHLRIRGVVHLRLRLEVQLLGHASRMLPMCSFFVCAAYLRSLVIQDADVMIWGGQAANGGAINAQGRLEIRDSNVTATRLRADVAGNCFSITSNAGAESG